MTTASLIERRERALGAGAQLFYRTPLHIVRGEGVCLFDAEGRRYIDMYNNVPCVGHGNPKVAEAMARQQATLNVHSRYLHEGVIEFAERLAGLHGPAIEAVVFSCSGTEAVEVAIRMARFATGRRGVVCTDATYHGSNEMVGGLTRLGLDQPANPEVRTFPFPRMYRPVTPGASEAAIADAHLARLAEAIEGLKESGAGFATLIVCSIFANEGLPEVPRRFMARAAEMAHAAGGLAIADEVQAGYGRTGRWWGYEATGFTPDIVVTGKPMGNGLPLAATAASRTLVEGFRAKTRYFNTFASTPLQAAVGMAVIDEIEEKGLIDNAAVVGAALKDALRERMAATPKVGDVRGEGLFLGIEMVTDKASDAPDRDAAIEIVERLKDRGFLTGAAGASGNVVKIRPPLVFSRDNAAAFLDAWDVVAGEIHG
ncbi:MAG TPA: aminotransferase class III-fold pyridoxal phosphate-dependent enzyme [Caulobacteraceae bacterium]|nr:aminotransferase class III-fold pyridoxal phosphate-dependent enzyme [Caulobacteraceae bacterium]